MNEKWVVHRAEAKNILTPQIYIYPSEFWFSTSEEMIFYTLSTHVRFIILFDINISGLQAE